MLWRRRSLSIEGGLAWKSLLPRGSRESSAPVGLPFLMMSIPPLLICCRCNFGAFPIPARKQTSCQVQLHLPLARPEGDPTARPQTGNIGVGANQPTRSTVSAKPGILASGLVWHFALFGQSVAPCCPHSTLASLSFLNSLPLTSPPNRQFLVRFVSFFFFNCFPHPDTRSQTSYFSVGIYVAAPLQALHFSPFLSLVHSLLLILSSSQVSPVNWGFVVTIPSFVSLYTRPPIQLIQAN